MRQSFSIGLALSTVFVLASVARAQVNAPAEKSGAEILSAISKTLSTPPSLQVNISTTETLNRSVGLKETTVTTSQVWFKKPNLLLLVHQTPVGASITYCNGTSVSIFRPVFKAFYTERQAPDAHQKILNAKLDKVAAAIILGQADQLPSILNDTQPITVRGMRTAAGQAFDEIELTSAPATSLLVSQGSPPFPAVVSIVNKTGGDTLTTLTTFTWNTMQDYDPVMFNYVSTPGTVQVKTEAELTGNEMPGLPEGTPAPPLTLPVTPGGELDTGRLRGKIVVLDFFVTKCIGCNSTITTLTEILRDYKDRGVEIVPINVKEKREVVETYFKENKLSIPVALDLEGKAAAAYRIQKVPQTFVIDGDGIIRHIHAGLQPNFREELRSQLDKLLEK